jgi:hypothetical protein
MRRQRGGNEEKPRRKSHSSQVFKDFVTPSREARHYYREESGEKIAFVTGF